MPKTEITSNKGLVESAGEGLVIQGARVSDDGTSAGTNATMSLINDMSSAAIINYVPIMRECKLTRLRAVVSGDVGAQAGLIRIYKNGATNADVTAAAIAVSGSADGAQSDAFPGSNTDITHVANRLWPAASGSVEFSAGDVLSIEVDITTTNAVSAVIECDLEKA